MILGSDKIRERLEKNQIFRPGTWDPACIKEASYALRIANDGMIIDNKEYEPDGSEYPMNNIIITPGSIAILSTMERLCMPGDLVGRLGVRLHYASMGLTGLMGIQVDPYYGQNRLDERLYIKVANFGNEQVILSKGATVFNIEFSLTEGASNPNKRSTWERIEKNFNAQKQSNWTHMTQVKIEFRKELDKEIGGIRDNQQSVVMFGVFLVAITILGVLLTILFNVDNPPNWVTQWGWIILMVLFTIAVAAIVIFVVAAGLVFLKTSGVSKKRK